MKTSEITGAALDWAVAKCEGIEVKRGASGILYYAHFPKEFSPSTNWAQGGTILEREGISVQTDPTDPENPIQGLWSAYFRAFLFDDDGGCFCNGMTPLEAAMRCYVTISLGIEVEIPEEMR